MQKVIKEIFFLFKCFFLMLMKVSHFSYLCPVCQPKLDFHSHTRHMQMEKLKQIVKIFLPFTQKVVLSANYPFSSQVVTTCIHIHIYIRPSRREEIKTHEKENKNKNFRKCLHFCLFYKFIVYRVWFVSYSPNKILCEAKYSTRI